MATKMLFLRRFRGGKENIGEGSGGGGCTNVMHGRSRVTIDPRILTMPGRSMSGFHRPGKIGGGGLKDQWIHALKHVVLSLMNS